MTTLVKVFTIGRFLTNCYIAWSEKTREAIMIDPSCDNQLEAEKIFKFISDKALTLRFIVNTHGHPDHVCGNGIVKARFHTPIMIHEYDSNMLGKMGRRTSEFLSFESWSPEADRLLHNDDILAFGEVKLKVIHTPGHSCGCISLLEENAVFTGDTLFAGSIGRTDFPESSMSDMISSLKKLGGLPDTLTVYPGHGPTTTIRREKSHNPFLQRLQS